ncbi:MAG: ribosome recycling factor [Spirochaetales bacterium]|nr:ribosome recycling factor [Spirochaetales bacterium]
MKEIIKDAEDKMAKSVSNLETEFATLRTGRASASLFDTIKVNYYGNQTPLNQTANISVPEPRTVVIQPWDKGMLSEIEKAIQKSELGFNPSNDGKIIRINIPALTEQRRKELAKLSKEMAEKAKVAIRNIRRDSNDALKKAQKNGDITEDELKKGEDDIQKTTDKYVKNIDDVQAAKQKEIMED